MEKALVQFVVNIIVAVVQTAIAMVVLGMLHDLNDLFPALGFVETFLLRIVAGSLTYQSDASKNFKE